LVFSSTPQAPNARGELLGKSASFFPVSSTAMLDAGSLASLYETPSQLTALASIEPQK
jgi:hypothetical protein